MTRFTVTWDDEAINDLADIWMQATDPAAVTTASDIVDRTLRLDADCQGKEVQEGLRYLIVSPLRVLFEVWPEDRHAKVLRVLKQPRTS